MIAIFNTEQESINYSNMIHNYLTINRVGYNALKWSDVNKSDNENKWCVYLPTDYTETNNSIVLVETLPNNWKNIIERI